MGREGMTFTADFQFVQNNMTQVAAGNVEHVMAETEHRHGDTFEHPNAEYLKNLGNIAREARAEKEQLKTFVDQLKAANAELAHADPLA